VGRLDNRGLHRDVVLVVNIVIIICGDGVQRRLADFDALSHVSQNGIDHVQARLACAAHTGTCAVAAAAGRSWAPLGEVSQHC
jgi:hypothetical protein